MSIIIRQAKTTSELNDVLATRYRVLEQSGRRMGPQTLLSKKIVDHLDIYPMTINVAAYSGGQPIGCSRMVEYSPSEPLLNLSFDFTESFANLKGPVYCLNMMAIAGGLSTRSVIERQLIKMSLNLVARREAKHAFFACPVNMLENAKNLGFKSIQDPTYSSALEMDVCPMVIDVAEFYDRLTSTIADREIMRFQEVFYCSVFEAGEVIVAQGEKGSTAYLIEDGEVEVLIKGKDQLIPISTIGRGQLIGEIAMVTNEPRTASVISKTVTSCIAFDRSEFMRLLYSQPHRSLDIFKIFSKRLSESNRRLAEVGR